jgi:hypothetical protein
LLEDVVIYTLILVELTIVYSTLRLLDQVEVLLAGLPAGEVGRPGSITSSRESVRDFISLCHPRSRMWHSVVMGFCLLIVVFFQILIPLFMPQPVKGWAYSPHEHPASWAVSVLWATFAFVLVLGNVLWYGLSAAFTVFPLVRKHLENRTMIIIPVAPDGKGGLAQVGTVAFKLNLIVSSGMVFVVAWMILFGIDLRFVIGFLVYLVFLVGMFFLPLLSIHNAMQAAKDDELTRFAKLFEEAYVGLCSGDDRGDAGAVKQKRDTAQYLASLEQLYKRAELMPVWPFNFQILGQFTTLVLVPLILFIVQVVSQNSITAFLQRLSN